VLFRSENVIPDGRISSKNVVVLTKSSLPNIGVAKITIPSNVSTMGNRFYLKVISTNTIHIFGWSCPFFLDYDREVAAITAEDTKDEDKEGEIQLSSRRVLGDANPSAIPTSSPAAKCTSYIVGGSSAGGSLGAIKVIGATLFTPSLTGSFTMSGPSTVCFSTSVSSAAYTSNALMASSTSNSTPSLMPLATVDTAYENYYTYYNTYYYYGNYGGNNSKTPTVLPTIATSSYPTYSYSSHAVIIHRYSFNNSANDSVGGSAWNGQLKEGAYISNSTLRLQWTGSNSTYPHVELPYGITEGYPILTIELWAVVENNNGSWTHFFTFASKKNSNQNSINLRITGDKLTTQVVGSSSQSSGVGYISSSKIANQLTYIAATYNTKTTNITLYVNGTFVGSSKAKSKLPFIGITANNYIGKSCMDLDLGFIGEIDEFRIWAGELNSTQIMSSYLAGPDASLYSVSELPINGTASPTYSPITLTTMPIKVPSAVVDTYQDGFIFTNSYSTSTCSGEVLFSFGDYVGYCVDDSPSYKYFINPGKI